jgi:antitoxin component YwqK of YwqJK toxin-antitoxin module
LQSVRGQENITDGYVKFYYPNGQVSSEGLMINGKPDGYWKTYYVTGIIKSEGKRTNHLLDSIWLFYDVKGDTIQKISYMYGKKNGYLITFDYSTAGDGSGRGTIISKELYIDDRKEGKSYYYFPDAKLKSEVSYLNGKKQGLSKEFDESGKTISLVYYHNGYVTEREDINRKDKNGLKQGVWREFYPDGRIKKEENYVNDILDGFYKEYNEKGDMVLLLNYKKGNLVIDEKEAEQDVNVEIRNKYDDQSRLISSGAFRNNIPVGIHREFGPDGSVTAARIYNDAGKVVSEGIIDIEGKRVGEWKDYYPEGNLKATGNYVDNLRSGKWTFYFRNNKIEQTGEYIKGKENGIWTWYYENGNTWREESYFNGREDGVMVEYLENGKVITRGDYVDGEKEGEWYYRVGDHIEVGSYITGLRDGKWKYFYNDSTLQYEGDYFQGNPDGKHKLYYENGNVKEERYYSAGIREKIWKRYDVDGNVVMTIGYKNDEETRINGVKLDLPERETKLIQ